MADAVHGAEHEIGLAKDAAELTFVVLDSPVVVDEVTVQPLDEGAEVIDDSRPPADIGNPPPAEVDCRAKFR